ncbi:unnamed protein product [Arabidopsis halleri]
MLSLVCQVQCLYIPFLFAFIPFLYIFLLCVHFSFFR